MNYFNQNMDLAMNLLRRGTITWIEVYPGIFGREAGWRNWTAPRICPGRIPACVANTQKMDETLAAKLKELLG